MGLAVPCGGEFSIRSFRDTKTDTFKDLVPMSMVGCLWNTDVHV